MKRLRASEERHSHASLGAAPRQARVNDDVCRVNKISGMTNTKLPGASVSEECQTGRCRSLECAWARRIKGCLPGDYRARVSGRRFSALGKPPACAGGSCSYDRIQLTG
jgi:hypothetical protein